MGLKRHPHQLTSHPPHVCKVGRTTGSGDDAHVERGLEVGVVRVRYQQNMGAGPRRMGSDHSIDACPAINRALQDLG